MEELRYSGNWEILGKECFGNLIINDKKGIIRLILHNRDNLNSLFSNKDIPSKINFIKGNLIPYGVMSLLNATVISRNTNISYSTKTIELDIEYCINCDFKDYNNVKFSKMVFHLSNTLAWSGLNGISTDYQKHGSFILKHKFKKAITYSRGFRHPPESMPHRLRRPDGIRSAAPHTGADTGAPAPANRPHPSDPRPHGGHRLPAHRRFSLWQGKPGPDRPAGSSCPHAFSPASPHRPTPFFHRPAAPGYGGIARSSRGTLSARRASSFLQPSRTAATPHSGAGKQDMVTDSCRAVVRKAGL